MRYDQGPSQIEVAGASQSFEYAESPDALFVPSWSGWEDAPDAAGADPSDGVRQTTARAEDAGGAEFERRFEEEMRCSFESGRARGIEEGRKAERQARDEVVAAEEEKSIRQGAALVEKFAAERERYFRPSSRKSSGWPWQWRPAF